jgi:signal recognition particle subunit SRP54
MIPGVPKALKNQQIDERELDQWKPSSLDDPRGRRLPDMINGSRRKRIAGGSGTSVQAVNQLISRFKQMQKMMKQLASGKGGKGMPNIPPEMLKGGF